MKYAFGLPIVNANNIFPVLADMGIRRWNKTADALPLSEYVKGDLTPAQRVEADRFAPKPEVMCLEQPNGTPFTGFRTIGKDWATTFVMFPGDLVAVVGEYKHGCDAVTLVPPSGVLSKADAGQMALCAMRETSEELGLKLRSVISLSKGTGLPMSGRQSTLRYHPFLGDLPEDIVIGPSTLDKTEHLKMVLVPLVEWMDLIDRGLTNEMCAGDVTYRALRGLGRLSLT